MQTIQPLQSTYSSSYSEATPKTSIVTRFFAWCTAQESNRLLWLAAILTIHGCVLAPITVFSIFLSGNNMLFWAMTIAAMAMSLITNLAALPTKITIPVFFISILIDLAVIISSTIIFLKTY